MKDLRMKPQASVELEFWDLVLFPDIESKRRIIPDLESLDSGRRLVAELEPTTERRFESTNGYKTIVYFLAKNNDRQLIAIAFEFFAPDNSRAQGAWYFQPARRAAALKRVRAHRERQSQ